MGEPRKVTIESIALAESLGDLCVRSLGGLCVEKIRDPFQRRGRRGRTQRPQRENAEAAEA